MTIPESADYPAIAYARISGSQVQSMAGPARLGETRTQITMWCPTFLGVRDLAQLVRRAMDGFEQIEKVMGGIVVQAVTMVDESDMPPEYSEDGSRILAFGVRQDYEIFFEQDTT